jgi:two-component system cell cycle sensor histidine kinase/response regulator CckA
LGGYLSIVRVGGFTLQLEYPRAGLRFAVRTRSEKVDGKSMQGSLFSGEWEAAPEKPGAYDLVEAESSVEEPLPVQRVQELIVRMGEDGTLLALCDTADPGSSIELHRGRPAGEVLGPELARSIASHMKGVLESGEIQAFDVSPSLLDMDLTHEVRIFKSGEDEVTAVIRNVGESRMTQLRLMESENRYRHLLDQSLQGTLVIQDFRIVYVNEEVARISGIPVAEILRLTPEEMTCLVHPQDRDVVWGRMRDRLENKLVPSYYEFRLVRRDGTLRWVEINSTLIEYRGKPAVQASLVDVTERKNAEAELLVEKAYLEELFENAPEAIVLVDNESRVLKVNGEFTRTFGFTIEELQGKSIDEAIAPADLYEEAVQLTKLIKQGERVYVETVRRHRNGTPIDVSVVGTPIVVNGEQVAVYGIYRDITERKRMEEKYRILVENATDAIMILQDRHITFHNPRAEALYGYAGKELKKHPFFEYVHPEERSQMEKTMQRWLSGEEPPGTVTMRCVTQKREIIWVEVNAVGIVWEGEPALLCFIRDISTEKRLGAQLQQAQKMEAIGTLAGGVAHDFNNLLQAVLGYSDLLLLERDRDGSGYHELQGIRNAALRATELTQQLLTFSRKVESKLRPINLNNEIMQVRELLGRTIPKMIAIDLRLEKYLHTVNADPNQIGQALMNLAVNAKDAMPEGGTMTIETGNVTLDEQFCASHVGAKPGAYVMLSVNDTGMGMDKETRAHIFEPFYTTKSQGTGTGLGLAMVYGIVKGHGGYIECDSVRGKGAEFRIYLPVIEQEPVIGEEEDTALPKGGTETILIIDDEKLIRDLGEKALSSFGYMVLTAPDGASAIKLYSSEWERIDLIILDLIMPRMSGTLCFEKIMEINPDAKVIIASGYAENGRMKRSIEKRVRGFIGKPFNVRHLLRAIREILDGD